MGTNFLHGVEIIEVDDGVRPIETVRSSVIGIVGRADDADVTVWPLDTPVLVTPSDGAKIAKLGAGTPDKGFLSAGLKSIFAQAGAVVVAVRTAVDEPEKFVGRMDTNGNQLGAGALLYAEAKVGVKPRIITCPIDYSKPAGGDIVDFINGGISEIAEKLKAIVVVDGPNTIDEDAIAAAKKSGSPRLYMVDPGVRGPFGDVPVSPYVAGVIARTDGNLGFWFSPSNKNVGSVTGTQRLIDFTLGDENSRANLLNEANVATIIQVDGWRLWGNRTLSSDKKWAFLSVRRTADMINESLQVAHLWAVDRAITRTYVEDVLDSVNAYLRSLKTRGAILGGTCWVDPEFNTPDDIASGNVRWDFDFTAPSPAERVTFGSHLVNGYATEIFG